MKYLLLCFLLLSNVAFATKIHINITLKGAKDGAMIYFEDEVYKDSAYFKNETARFTYDQKSIDPTQVKLYTKDMAFMMGPFIENQDLTINGTLGQNTQEFTYTGSKTTNELLFYIKAKQPEQDALKQVYAKIRTMDKQQLQFKVDSIYKVILQKEMAFTKQFPHSFITPSLPDLAYRDRKIDKQGALDWFNSFPNETKNTKAGQDFLTAIKKYNILHKGDDAPEIAVFDANKKPVKLSDYKDKDVLLVFWASWCGPCRAEIPKLKEIHKANPDIQIISFSLDDNDTLWKKAINELDIPWLNISDLKGFVASDAALNYGVSGIPAVYYIKKGKIAVEHLNIYGFLSESHN